MARIHLFEIEDQSWCPPVIRETTTDFLFGLFNLLGVYDPAYQKITEILEKTKTNAIVDCCSGTGGPINKLREHLDQHNHSHVTITLTDKYPNLSSFEKLQKEYPGKIIGLRNSFEATSLPASLKGMRTFFSSFHHFTPDNAVKILQNAVDNKMPIGIFESTQRQPIDFIRAIVSPILMLFIMPLARRLTWRKFFFTYVLPIAPFVVMWDYIVSNLRTYSPKELQGLIAKLNAPGYHWEYGKLWSKKARAHVVYLIGYPTEG